MAADEVDIDYYFSFEPVPGMVVEGLAKITGEVDADDNVDFTVDSVLLDCDPRHGKAGYDICAADKPQERAVGSWICDQIRLLCEAQIEALILEATAPAARSWQSVEASQYRMGAL